MILVSHAIPEPQKVLKNLAEARGSVLPKYEPVASHGDPVRVQTYTSFWMFICPPYDHASFWMFIHPPYGHAQGRARPGRAKAALGLSKTQVWNTQRI